MQRYFGVVKGNEVSLSQDDIFHLTRVMRAKVGDQIEVVSDNQVYLCQTTCFTPLKIEIINEVNENSELPNKVTLVVGVLKGEKMDLVLQKATELGVSEIVLLNSERTVAKIKDESKLERFRKILKEASEQSKRSRIPSLEKVINVNGLSTINSDIKMIAFEGEKGSSKSFNKVISSLKDNESITIVIGPEGGFNDKEVKIANEFGFTSVSLGNRILRAETAVFYSLSVIANRIEDK